MLAASPSHTSSSAHAHLNGLCANQILKKAAMPVMTSLKAAAAAAVGRDPRGHTIALLF